MTHAAPAHDRLPRTLDCPRCAGRMNLTGPGRAAGTVTYFCGGCAPAHRVRELWRGKVVRTGTRGFGFVALTGPQELDPVRFSHDDYLVPDRAGDRPGRAPRVGDQVLVLLGDHARHAQRVWQLPFSTPRPAERQDRAGHGSRRPHNGRPANGHSSGDGNGAAGRRQGSIVRLGGPDWGFISEYGTGRVVFVHQSQWRGRAQFAPGLAVTYRTIPTPKGDQARDVRPLRGD